MSIHLSNGTKTTRSPCTFVQIPPPSSSPSSSSTSLPPLLDAALMTVVQQQQQQSSRTPPPGFDRNQFEHILINFAGVRSSMSPNSAPKTSKTGTTANPTNIPLAAPPPPPPPLPSLSSSSSSSTHGPPPNQHHLPLLTTHSFLYNPVEPCIFPIAIPPGFSSSSPEFMRLFAPNMAAVAAATATNPSNPSAAAFVPNSTLSQSSRSTSQQSNGTSTPPEPAGPNLSHQPSISSSSSTNSRHQQSHYRHRHHYPTDPHQFQQNTNNHFHSQRQSQNSYPQQQHNRPKACYTCGDLGHLAFACPEQYTSDSNYSHTTRGNFIVLRKTNNIVDFFSLSLSPDSYQLDYRPRQSTPTNFHHSQQRQLRSNSNSKTKLRENS